MPLDISVYDQLFIQEDEVKALTVIDNNVDTKVLAPMIRLAQDMKLQPVLGTALFVDLQTKIKNSSLSDNENALWKMYIKPMLAWYIVASNNFFNTYKSSNKGLSKMSSENTEVPDLQEINNMSYKAENAAEDYENRLIDFLNTHSTEFPAYNNSAYAQGDILPTRISGYQSGIYLGQSCNSNDPKRRSAGGYKPF